MKTFTLVSTALLFLTLTSCQKNLDAKKLEENQQKATEFKTFVTGGEKFRLVHYYSDKPIDYIWTDSVVKQETDLDAYIRFYLVDDDIIFNTDGNVSFYQNTERIGNDNSDVITLPFNVEGKLTGVDVNYIDDEYNPLSYQLVEMGSNYFILKYKRFDNALLFSRFEMVQ